MKISIGAGSAASASHWAENPSGFSTGLCPLQSLRMPTQIATLRAAIGELTDVAQT